MNVSLDSGDREFLERLHRLEAGTVQEICAELGVTATAVRQRLGRLLASQLVSRELVRSGRGRPHFTWRVTRKGLRRLGDNYADLAMILWRELRNVQEPAVRASLLERIQASLADQYGSDVRGGSLSERMDQLGNALSERGFDVEVDATGALPVLRENNCPYLELASHDPAICELEQAVFRSVLDADVRRTQCCLDGHACCEFEAVERAG